LTPAFPFDEVRRLTGKIGKRWIERRFKITDEFLPEVDAFASAIQNKCSIEPDGVQGHRDMIIVNAIYESARKQRAVSIGY
jgi:predicted dehydrogenase